MLSYFRVFRLLEPAMKVRAERQKSRLSRRTINPFTLGVSSLGDDIGVYGKRVTISVVKSRISGAALF
ncbi:MAG: hypothetical protein NVS3B5_03800 [Sphingomicrobium sp.]